MIEKAKPIAAHLLEASEDDLEFTAGRFPVRGTDKGIGIAEVALAAFAAHNLPEGSEPTIDADATYDPVNFSFPHGTHLCAMEVDTETGAVKMRKYVCVDDIGTIINPLIVEGQVHGGLVQGIAQALWEEAVYDDSGTLVTGVLRRLPAAHRGRPDQLRHRPHHLTRRPPTRSAPRASARPAPSPRPRRSSTPSSTRSGTSASTTSRCRARPSGSGRRSTAAARGAARTRRPCRTSTRAADRDPGPGRGQ